MWSHHAALALVVVPLARDQPRATQAVQERVDGAVASRQPARPGKVAHELQAESGMLLQQRQHAGSEHPGGALSGWDHRPCLA